jgi:hypothetical protein
MAKIDHDFDEVLTERFQVTFDEAWDDKVFKERVLESIKKVIQSIHKKGSSLEIVITYKLPLKKDFEEEI